MENIIVGEKQLRIEFQGKVSSETLGLILKAVESHKPIFSFALFRIFSLTMNKKDKMNRIINLFKRKPKNAEEIRTRILNAQDILSD